MLKDTKEKFYDVRLIERHIYKGAINPQEYKKHLKSLPDESENAEEINLEKDPTPDMKDSQTPSETSEANQDTNDIGL